MKPFLRAALIALALLLQVGVFSSAVYATETLDPANLHQPVMNEPEPAGHAAAAPDAGTHEEHPGGPEEHAGASQLPRFVNLAIMLAILYFLLRKPLQEFFFERTESIFHELEKAGEDRKEAESLHQSTLARLAGAKEEISRMVQDGAEESKHTAASIVEKARRDAVRLAETFERRIEAETQKAQTELEAYALQLASDLASEHLRKSFNADRQAAYLKQLTLQ